MATSVGEIANPEYQLKVAWPHLPLGEYNSAKESEMVTLSESQRQIFEGPFRETGTSNGRSDAGALLPDLSGPVEQVFRTLFTEEPFGPRDSVRFPRRRRGSWLERCANGRLRRITMSSAQNLVVVMSSSSRLPSFPGKASKVAPP